MRGEVELEDVQRVVRELQHCSLPFLPSNEFHDYHHANFTSNFGTFGLLDHVLGTDARFQRDVHSKRNCVLWGWEPATSRWPTQKKAQ